MLRILGMRSWDTCDVLIIQTTEILVYISTASRNVWNSVLKKHPLAHVNLLNFGLKDQH